MFQSIRRQDSSGPLLAVAAVLSTFVLGAGFLVRDYTTEVTRQHPAADRAPSVAGVDAATCRARGCG